MCVCVCVCVCVVCVSMCVWGGGGGGGGRGEEQIHPASLRGQHVKIQELTNYITLGVNRERHYQGETQVIQTSREVNV